MTRLRTVAALHLGQTSGPSRDLEPIVRHLAGRGDVVVAVPSRDTAADALRAHARIAVTGHEPLVMPRSARDAATLPGRLRRDVRRFRGLLRDERADLAIIATRTLPALTLAARLERVPAVLYVTELYAHGLRGDAVRGAAWRPVVRLNVRLASAIVTPTRLVAAGLPSSSPIVVAHPAIDPAVAGGDAEALRRRHGIPSTGPVLATLGSISRGRGQDLALRALALLRREHPGARLIVAGAPHARDVDLAFDRELRVLAAELGIADAVHFCGFSDSADVLAACDVFVNPARVAETFGRTAMESLLAGRPVVSADVGAVREVLGDGRSALLVEPGRPEAIAAAVRRLLSEPGLADSLVTSGRERVLASYGAERQLAQFARAIDIALTDRTNGSGPGRRA